MLINLLRLHNTDQKEIDLTREYLEDDFSYKPNGLYYSIGFEWIWFAQVNMPDRVKDKLFHLNFIFNKILFITDKNSLDNFFNTYFDHDKLLIDWKKVRADYSGIEIHNVNSDIYNPFKNGFPKTKPYIDSLKYALIKSFDVDSGCIWDLTCINLISEVIPINNK